MCTMEHMVQPELVRLAPTPKQMAGLVRRSPRWYRTPIAVIPISAAAFLVGNLLLMLAQLG